MRLLRRISGIAPSTTSAQKPDQRLKATSSDHRDHGIPDGAACRSRQDLPSEDFTSYPRLTAAVQLHAQPRSAMPPDPCPEAILIEAAGQADLLEGRGFAMGVEAISPLVVLQPCSDPVFASPL